MPKFSKAVMRQASAPEHDNVLSPYKWQPMISMLAYALLIVHCMTVPPMIAALSNQPEDADKVKAAKDPYFWGPYRSNLYFGIRATTPNSPMIGVMWYDNCDPTGLESTIQDSLINTFRFATNDGEKFGEQVVMDSSANMKLTTKMLKNPDNSTWNSRVYVEPIDNDKPMDVKVMVYALYDTQPGRFVGEVDGDQLLLAGISDDIGNFLLRVASDVYDIGAERPLIHSLRVDQESSWRMRENYQQALLKKQQEDEPNLYIYEFAINSARTISLHCSEIQHDATFDDYVFEMKASLLLESFKERFTSVFKAESWSEDEVSLGHYALSNLLGGIIYLHGSTFTLVHGKEHHEIVESQPVSLFTDTPSRSTFARGFLWDSGFQNLLIQDWNPLLTVKILMSWLDQMSEDGWIAREQIPGKEARANVPGQLCIQNPQYANPPGLLLTMNRLIENLNTMQDDTKVQVTKFLRGSYDKFKKNYEWYFKTQHGHCGTQMHCFRWRGRSKHHTLTSGLDDYPRADLPDERELHVDLASWMAFASKVMMKYAQLTDNTDDFSHYYRNLKKIVNLIETVHWDEESGYYTDVILREDGGVEHIRHFGYVSIYPLLFGVSNPERATRVLQKVNDELLTDYGLRSLSPLCRYYMKGDQYWTGPIWINMNYLFLNALYATYKDIEGATEMYTQLRNNLIQTMLVSFQKTGFIWEQYNDVTGEGQRSHPFTGWSALILAIMAEQYQHF